MSYEIQALEAFDDNYIWAISNFETGHCVVVDPGDEDPVLDYISKRGLTLEAILLTHKHGDHVGGVDSLKKATGARTYGPSREAERWVNEALKEGDQIHLVQTGLELSVLELPGHTLGHIAYSNGTELFCGDTLFIAGCGRVFEGTMQQMYDSLNKLTSVGNSAQVYCAHEYTLANLNFARIVEPSNQALQGYQQIAEQLRREGRATVPSTIGLEKEINPFLRCHTAEVINSASRRAGWTLDNPVEVFSILREWKNSF